MNKLNAVWAVMAMLTIWLCANTAKTNSIQVNSDESSRINAYLLDKIMMLELECCKEEEVEEIVPEVVPEETESISFNEIFLEMRAIYGPGNTFVWNGKEYTTDYEEETLN